jgi:hypothetical protein
VEAIDGGGIGLLVFLQGTSFSVRTVESDYGGVLLRILQDHYRDDFLLWNVHPHPTTLQGFGVDDYFGKGTVRNVV